MYWNNFQGPQCGFLGWVDDLARDGENAFLTYLRQSKREVEMENRILKICLLASWVFIATLIYKL